MIKFFTYRFNILASRQQRMFDDTTKEQKFSEIIGQLRQNKKDQYLHYNSKYFLYFSNSLTDTIHLLTLAKEENYIKPTEGDLNVIQVPDIRTPFIYVIIDMVRQIILIQEKSTVFTSEYAQARLQDYFTQKLAASNVTVDIEPIIDKKTFWDEVNDADSVEEFDITLNAPNLFRGRFEASKFVQEVYEDFNISEFTIKLKSKLGHLKLMKENVQDFIALASAGAGTFVLKVIKDGQKKIIKSYQWVVRKSYPINEIEDINIQKLEEDLDGLDKLNDPDPKELPK